MQIKMIRGSKVWSFIFVGVFSVLHVTTVEAGSEKISKSLARVLEKQKEDQTDDPVRVFVMMKQLAPLPAAILGETRPSDREIMIKQKIYQLQAGMRELVDDLVQTASLSGAPSIQKYKFFWNVNGLMATATPETIVALSNRSDVTHIHLDRRIQLKPDFREEVDLDGDAYTYGLQRIGVPELRSSKSNLTGKGITVGIIDTGIDAKHPEFKNKKIIFKDILNGRAEAYDDHGHGTHCAGTISGIGANGTQIGIAPEVTLVIAKVFSAQGGSSLSTLLRAMEWMSDPDGNPSTNDRPRVINNSWGGGMDSDISNDPFLPAVMTWVQLEIFPSFAAGNEGPGTSTIGSPGGLPPSFAVGATDEQDDIADFSSRGPVKGKIDGKAVQYVKPDVSAPGYQVLSAMPGGRYGKMSGTSMAAPHVTGSVAILLNAFPQLTVKQVREVLMKSSSDLGDSGMDNTFGAGRLDINHAVEAAASMFQ